MITPERAAETVEILDANHPNGWRSGDPVTDGMTVVLASGLRSMVEALFMSRGRH